MLCGDVLFGEYPLVVEREQVTTTTGLGGAHKGHAIDDFIAVGGVVVAERRGKLDCADFGADGIEVEGRFGVGQDAITVVTHGADGAINSAIASLGFEVVIIGDKDAFFVGAGNGTPDGCLVEDLTVGGETFIDPGVVLDVITDDIIKPLMGHFVDDEAFEVC